jgi:ribosomal protein S18 acetylase RimI-like enzyme
MSEIMIVPSTLADVPAIWSLYRSVAAIEGGLARTVDETSEDYVRGHIASNAHDGISLLAQLDHQTVGEIHACEIHAFQPTPKVFAHVLSDLTVAVHPDYQGLGVGRALFNRLLQEVIDHHPHILRVELFARESNQRAIEFYQTLGFEVEGCFKGRIRGVTGQLEADIPMAWHRQSDS